MKKRYVLRKYVMADNLNDAIKQDKTAQVQDAWLDEKDPGQLVDAIGFRYEEE